MTNKIKLSIIIVNWNTRELLRNCLKSISQGLMLNAEGKKLNTEIIVVDNGSTDNSIEVVKMLKKSNSNVQIKLIENKKNLGFAKANNQGIEAAQGEYILLLNSDTVAKKGAIVKTIDWMDKNKNVDIVGCKLLNPDGSDQPSVGNFPNLFQVFKMLFLDFITGGWSMQSPNKIIPVDWVMGAFMMVRKKVFNEIGGFDENIFMYMEEVEWCYRAKNQGYKTFFHPLPKVIHIKGGSSKTGKTGPILNIYQGLIYFYQKHKPKWQLFLVRIMLKLKAGCAWFLGLITNNYYLKNTYGQAYNLV